jgi:mannose-6-phosphate isomerase
MSIFNGPVQLSNIFKPKIWGRRNLEPLFEMPGSQNGMGDPIAGERIGEVWVTDDTASFLNGPIAGLTLAEASEQYGPELHGTSWPGRRFPLLAKYIFTSDWLSVQVHPDDAYATAHDGISSRRIPTPRSSSD